MIRGYLKVLTLKALKEGDKTGYGLIKHLEKTTGHKPSFGSIYPLLDNLSKDKLVSFKEKDNKKTYSLSKKGEQELKDLTNKESIVWTKIEEAMKLFQTIAPTKDSKTHLKMIQMIKEKKIKIEDSPAEGEELKAVMMKLMISGKMKAHKKEVSKILKTAVKDLKKIK